MPRRELTQIPLDQLKNKWEARQRAMAEIASLQAFVQEIDEEVKQAMGEFEQATIGGVPVVNFALKDQYAWARFQETHPHIARQYLRPVTVDQLDKEGLLAVHAHLLAEFRVREYRAVNKTRAGAP